MNHGPPIIVGRCGATLELAEGVERLVTGFLGRLPDVRLQPGCAELLDAAQPTHRLAVASSSTRRLVDAVLAHFGLAHRFGAVVSGESVVHLKPAPDIFLHAAALLGCAPDECVVLEDSEREQESRTEPGGRGGPGCKAPRRRIPCGIRRSGNAADGVGSAVWRREGFLLTLSAAGVRAACAADMRVIAVPETDPAPFRALTDHVVADLHEARHLLGL